MEFEKIKNYLDNFAERREWNKYRTPKNLCMALSVEVAELVEIFQWMDTEQSINMKNDKKLIQAVSEELADILSYLIQTASVLNIDIYEAFWNKTKKNEEKYPLEKGDNEKLLTLAE